MVAVLRAELLEQRDRLRERPQCAAPARSPCPPSSGRSRDTAFTSAPLRHEIEDHLVVAARGGVVQRRVAVVVARVDVGVQLLDEILHRRHPAVGRVAMRVAGEAVAVSDAGRGVQRRDADATGRGLRGGVHRRIESARDHPRPPPPRAARRRRRDPRSRCASARPSAGGRRRTAAPPRPPPPRAHPAAAPAGAPCAATGCSDRRRTRPAASSRRRRSRTPRARTASSRRGSRGRSWRCRSC